MPETAQITVVRETAGLAVVLEGAVLASGRETAALAFGAPVAAAPVEVGAFLQSIFDIMATQITVAVSANSAGDALYRITGASVTLTFTSVDIADATFTCAVKNESSTNATLATQGAETIEGLTSMPFFGPGASIFLYSDGTKLRQL